MPDRREFIRYAGALACAAWECRGMGAAAEVSLQRLASDKGLLFGSCLALKYFSESAPYRQLFLSQCDIATPEIHMKWNALSNAPGAYDFTNADQFVAFCESNRIRVRGHTLVWYDTLPAWVNAQREQLGG